MCLVCSLLLSPARRIVSSGFWLEFSSWRGFSSGRGLAIFTPPLLLLLVRSDPMRLRHRCDPTASKRDHLWAVPRLVIFNQCSAIARRNERFNFQLFSGLAHLFITRARDLSRDRVIKA